MATGLLCPVILTAMDTPADIYWHSYRYIFKQAGQPRRRLGDHGGDGRAHHPGVKIQDKNQVQHDVQPGGQRQLILGFTLPTLFGLLFQQFYNLVDTMIVGKLLGAAALGVTKM